MKVIFSTLSLVLLVLLSATGGALVATFSTVGTSSNQQFSIETPTLYGVNEYTLIEVDEGDNDEEAEIPQMKEKKEEEEEISIQQDLKVPQDTRLSVQQPSTNIRQDVWQRCKK